MGRLLRTVDALHRQQSAALLDDYERAAFDSVRWFMRPFDEPPPAPPSKARPDGPLFRRLPSPRGPLAVFGYDYFTDHAKATGIATPRLLSFEGEWGSGEEYAYEALNLADGTRSVRQITAAVSTEYGSVPEELVTEYLRALQKIGVVQERWAGG